MTMANLMHLCIAHSVATNKWTEDYRMWMWDMLQKHLQDSFQIVKMYFPWHNCPCKQCSTRSKQEVGKQTSEKC